MQSIEGTVQNEGVYDDDEERATTEKNAVQQDNDLEMELQN